MVATLTLQLMPADRETVTAPDLELLVEHLAHTSMGNMA